MANKFSAKPEVFDGIRFASQKEVRRYRELRLLERAGEIEKLECHPVFKFVVDGAPVLIRSNRYPNGRHAKFTGDFAYFDKKRNRRIVEDVKGGQATKTEAYSLRKALVEAIYHIRVEEV